MPNNLGRFFWAFAGVPLLLMILATGCATAPRTSPSQARTSAIPADCFMTHRAVMTARGKEFALTGYLAISQTGGMRLIVSQMFGSPVADVLAKADGSVHVMRHSAMLKRKWIERNVAADLKCLFGRAATDCPVEEIDPKHLILQRRWYKIDLRIVDIKAGPQRAELFDESQASEQ